MILNLLRYTDFVISLGHYEKEVINFLEREVKDECVYVDIGANIGFITLTMASIAPRGRIYAFEPYLESREQLELNVNLNGFKNVVIHSEALSSHNGEAILEVNQNNTGGNWIRNLSATDDLSISGKLIVKTVIFNEVLANLTIDGVKLDVEGHELKVLMGMAPTLETSPPRFIIVETYQRFDEINRFLKKFGYRPNLKLKDKLNTIFIHSR